MDISLFDFDLPEGRIALRPAAPRDSARMLVVAESGTSDHGVRELPDFLRTGDVLVFNNTKVIPAYLIGKRGAAKVDANLIERVSENRWKALVRPARKFRIGDQIDFAGVTADVQEKGQGGEVTLRFRTDDMTAALESAGRMPLPPYIARKRTVDDRDREDYQTSFAEREGAVAAPTAGLHFTPELLGRIETKGVKIAFITLHVGAGTFLPVKVEDTADHVMHAEWGQIDAETAKTINDAKRIIAVGTTSLRLLESAADGKGRVQPFSGTTDIFITPGYRFKAVDLLLTNFHLPKSTLFMLVSAFSGLESIRQAYAHAIGTGYRFYSYGDACLLYENAAVA